MRYCVAIHDVGHFLDPPYIRVVEVTPLTTIGDAVSNVLHDIKQDPSNWIKDSNRIRIEVEVVS